MREEHAGVGTGLAELRGAPRVRGVDVPLGFVQTVSHVYPKVRFNFIIPIRSVDGGTEQPCRNIGDCAFRICAPAAGGW